MRKLFPVLFAVGGDNVSETLFLVYDYGGKVMLMGEYDILQRMEDVNFIFYTKEDEPEKDDPIRDFIEKSCKRYVGVDSYGSIIPLPEGFQFVYNIYTEKQLKYLLQSILIRDMYSDEHYSEFVE